MVFSIRCGQAEDVSDLTAIWRRSVEVSHGFLTPTDIDALEPEVSAGLEILEVWVAEDGGVPIGFLAMNGNMIEALFIDPAHMGKKLGRSFIEHAQKVRGNMATLRLDVNEQNPNALGFYQAMGFVVTGRSETDSAGRPWPLLHMTREAGR